MGVLKVSVFILCYFFARIALSATCEPYSRATAQEKICYDENFKAMFSEKCLKADCDAKKFLTQYKAKKVQMTPSRGVAAASAACKELQLPSVMMKDSKNNEIPFCLFHDGSVLDAAVVERLVL